MKTKALMVLLLAVFLSGCGSLPKATPTPLPTVVLGDNAATSSSAPATASLDESPAVLAEGGVRAAGFVVPAQEAQITTIAGGKVQAVYAAVGDPVREGQALVKLAGEEKLAAAVEAASMELLAAEQALRIFNDNAGQARTTAQLRLANAQQALDEAEKRRAWKEYRNGSQSTIDAAQADVILAKNTLEDAEEAYSAVADSAEDNLNRAAALSALANARKAYDRAVANLNYLLAMPSTIAVNQAEAELQAAQAEVESAQAEVDRLKEGADPDALALAEARVSNARAQLKASQAALDELELKAPFDGTVSRITVQAGEWAAAGQVVVIVADLERLQVETTDLSERDVARVRVDQLVTVTLKALGQNVSGRVVEVAPLADILGGDVVYQTVIELDNQPEGLRAGMSVEVYYGE